MVPFWSGWTTLKGSSSRYRGVFGKASLTILFEGPFWIGLYERFDEGKYETCKITFGSEPNDRQVYAFLLENWRALRFSPPVRSENTEERRLNPKRMRRTIRSQLQERGVGTKAQQALKLQHQQDQQERSARVRKRRETEKERQYEIRREKKKAKHKGR